MATLHAKNAIVYLASSAGVAAVVTEAADVSFDIDMDLSQDNAFGDTWMTQLKGFLKWSGTLTGNFDTAQASIFDAVVNATAPVNMYVYANRGVMTNYYYGTVWPRLGVQLPVGTAKFSMRFDGDGQLAAKP